MIKANTMMPVSVSRRRFAPYVGVEWQNKYGNTADFARLQDASTAETSWVAGVRFWF